MANGRISEITGTKSLTGGIGALDYTVKWYFLSDPTAVKVAILNNLPPDDFQTELDLYAQAEVVTFV